VAGRIPVDPRLTRLVRCKFRRPWLLRSPPVPLPMTGVNPRTLMGESWWDKRRREAYKANNWHCWACGVHVSGAAFHEWLEAHESYDIDYARGEMKLKEIVALCHCCHQFIHIARLHNRYQLGHITFEYAEAVVHHGYNVLRDAGMEVIYGGMLSAEEIINTAVQEYVDVIG